ncbi:hypothetical protein HF521_018078 [Silurus meridionalis]|uniref:Uncharacterized protein n=1 Tax=Silurus meridionalis TaxID=175797 RepID=A0A8T0BNU5_SILME|nr:hypothetical protein HF521_018078 [Silurus meridionalis]
MLFYRELQSGIYCTGQRLLKIDLILLQLSHGLRSAANLERLVGCVVPPGSASHSGVCFKGHTIPVEVHGSSADEEYNEKQDGPGPEYVLFTDSDYNKHEWDIVAKKLLKRLSNSRSPMKAKRTPLKIEISTKNLLLLWQVTMMLIPVHQQSIFHHLQDQAPHIEHSLAVFTSLPLLFSSGSAAPKKLVPISEGLFHILKFPAL